MPEISVPARFSNPCRCLTSRLSQSVSLAQHVKQTHDNFLNRVLSIMVPKFTLADVGKEFELNVEDETGPMVIPSNDLIARKYPMVRQYLRLCVHNSFSHNALEQNEAFLPRANWFLGLMAPFHGSRRNPALAGPQGSEPRGAFHLARCRPVKQDPPPPLSWQGIDQF